MKSWNEIRKAATAFSKRWKNAYNARNLVSGTTYSDTATPSVAYTYADFGNTLSATGALADVFRFRFSTKYFDVETDLYYYGYRFYSPSLMRWLNRDPIEEGGGVNLYGFCHNNSVLLYDIMGFSCTIGTFNVLNIVITSTPQWIMADLNALERDANALMDALGKAGYVSAASSLAASAGLSALLLNVADIATSNNMSPDVGSLSRSIKSLIDKLREQGLVRLDGVLKWERCECVGNKSKWVRQSDITDSEDIQIENIGTTSDYAVNFRNTYKKVEKNLIKKMVDQLKGKR